MVLPKWKKRKLQAARNPQVKRFKEDIDQFVEGKTSGQSSHDVHSQKGQQSRKELRKEKRKMKKIKRHAFAQRKKIPTVESMKKEREDQEKLKKKDKEKKAKRAKERKRRKEKKQAQRDEKDLELKAVEEAKSKDDKLINQLEKQLNMKRRKSKNLPKVFALEGLDYILEAVDSEKLQAIYDDGDEEESIVGPVLDSGSDEEDFSGDEEMNASSDETNEEDGDTKEDIKCSVSPKSNVKSILKKGALPTMTEKTVKFGDEDENKPTEEKKDKHPKSNKDLLAFIRESIKEVKAEKTFSKEDLSGSEEEEEQEDDSGDEEDNLADSETDEESPVDEEEGDLSVDEAEEKSSGDEEDKELSVKEEETHTLSEDIYGRLRDKDGNVVTTQKVTSTYVPPGKRLEMAATQNEKKRFETERLKKQIKGLINRLSESNMQSISSQLEEMFRSCSRAELTESLADIILEAVISPVLIPERLIMEQVMLLAILHGNVGNEVGALFLQKVAEMFRSLCNSGSTYGEGKEMDNLLVIFAHMFNFKMIHSVLIFDILKKFSEAFKERDIELILILLKNVGFTLRKDDPATLKEIIIEIQAKASSVDTTKFSDQSRVKFMLEVLMAVRNNNMRKIPNYDPSHMEHLWKVLRNYVKGSNFSDLQLRISLEDLLQAESKGRWWLVGSAWSGRDVQDAPDPSHAPLKTVFSAKILELARKQRMNTDVRKNIFCSIMTSEDFVDAFEKLLRLNLKHQQEREIIHVIMDVCMQEKKPNPFYAFLTQKFCEFHRRFQMTVQFHVWDLLKVLSEQTSANIHNLAVLITHLIATKALSLSVFKTVEFSELDKHKLQLLKTVLQDLLLNYQEQSLTEVFSRIAPFPKLARLREALKVFMKHFLLRKMENTEEGKELERRIDLAIRALGSAEMSMRL